MPGFGNLSTAKMGGLFRKSWFNKRLWKHDANNKWWYTCSFSITIINGSPKEEEDNNDDYYKTNSLNIADIRNNP